MFPNIRLDLFKRPVCERVDFDKACFIDFDDVERTSGSTLGFSTTGEDGADVKLCVCSTGGFHFYEVVVLGHVSGPELWTVGSDEGVKGWCSLGGEDVELGCRVSTVLLFREGRVFRGNDGVCL